MRSTFGSRRARRGAALATIALAAAVVGCKSSTSSAAREPHGTYVLTQLNGATVPGVVKTTPEGGRIELLSGTIEVQTRGRLVESRTLRNVNTAGASPPYDESFLSPYELRGDRLLITRPGLVASDTYVDTATITRDGALVVKARNVGLALNVGAQLIYLPQTVGPAR